MLTARLGRGGMADVYRARREGAAGFERTVVVKKILSSHNEDPQFVDMFINEAKIAVPPDPPEHRAGLRARRAVDGEFFIVMEYVKGKDLLRLLRTLAQPSRKRPRCRRWWPRTSRARRRAGSATRTITPTRTARRKPIVHRDVSPQNIMLSYDGQVKLVDFGIAKAIDSMKEETRTGALKGKFAYMAPEQVGGAVAGAAVGRVLRRRGAARDADRAAAVQGRQRLRDAAEGADHGGAAAVDGEPGGVARARRHRAAGARARSRAALHARRRTWRATSTCFCRRTASPSRTWPST